jgi:hypothetical protein
MNPTTPTERHVGPLPHRAQIIDQKKCVEAWVRKNDLQD